MEILLGEHGEMLLYGIVGIIMVVIIFSVCGTKWNKIAPEYNIEKSKDNSNFIDDNSKYKPVIEADDIIYAAYRSDFNCMDYISAKSHSGKDITSMIKVYGQVNTLKKGIYKLKCTVFDNDFMSTKYINVIVE